MKTGLSLKHTWTALVLFAVIVPVIIMMTWYGQRLYKSQLSNALGAERHANELLHNQIESEIRRFKTLLKNKSDPLSFLLNRKDKPTALRDINSLLKNIVEREQAIHEVMVLSTQADVIAVVDPGIGITGDKLLSTQELRSMGIRWGFDKANEYPEVIIPSLGRTYMGSPEKHDNVFAFKMAVPIGKPAKAILIALINVNKLWSIDTEKHGIGKVKTRDYILDRRGVLANEINGSDYKPGDIMTHLPIARTALINGEWPTEISYIGVLNQPVYGTLTTIPSLSWTLVSEVIASNIIQPIRASLYKTILFTLFGIIIFVWFVLHLASKTLRPIQHACEAIDHVARGDYQFVLEPPGIRELDEMITGFNNMAKARQNAENSLRQSEERFSLAVSGSNDGIWDWDLKSATIFFSPRWKQMLGYELDDIDNNFIAWRDLVHPDDLGRFLVLWAKYMGGQSESFFIEYRIRRKTGDYAWVLCRGSSSRDEADHLIRLSGSQTDITERKQFERELARFKSTLDRALDCVFMFEPKSLKFFYVNRGAMEQVGYSHEEMMQMTPVDIKPKFDEAQFRKLIIPLIDGPVHTTIFETIHQHKDGHHISVEVSLQYVSPKGEPPRFVAFVRDITERQQLQKQLQQAQKMEAIGQLTGGIAHDFNNMLSGILGFTELAREELAQYNNEKIEDYLSQVYASGTRARDLVAQMLAFSRGGEGELEPYMLVPLIKESLKMLGNTLPSSIKMDLQLDNDNLIIMTNPVHLHQLVMNLCINARDAMNGKGNISIELHHATFPEGDFKVITECRSCHERIKGDYIQLSVSDSGSGILPEQLDRIFDPFYTTKDVGKGTGMGLSMVHGIMHDHGGHIIVETGAGKGTTFALLFPAIDTQVDIANRQENDTKTSSNQTLEGNILIVDDEVSVGHFIGELLKINGCKVTVETDSQSALSRFRENPEAFDLVVTDQTMPGITGAELAQAMLEIRPDLPIVLCTGYSDQIDEARAKAIGMRGYVNKPIETDAFMGVVKDLLQARKIIPAGMEII